MASIKRRARALTRPITVPVPWSVEGVCAQVSVLLGLPIVVERDDKPRAGTPTASVRREVDRYVIRYRGDHHNPDHLIAHELGHLLAGHLNVADLSGGVDSDLKLAARTMSRSCTYDNAAEALAEAVADVLLAGARAHTRDHGAARVSTGAATTLRGFGEALR